MSVIFVSSHVLKNETPWSLAALLFGPGLGLGFALKDIIHDVLAGIILTIDKQFQRGHYILHEGHKGEIEDISWNNTIIRTVKNSRIVIPNRSLLKKGFENFDVVNPICKGSLNLFLDQDIDPERAQRLLKGAVMKVRGVGSGEGISVYAISITEGGTEYNIKYPIKNVRNGYAMKHQVLNAITNDLHKHGYKISESLGEYYVGDIKPKMYNRPEFSNFECLSKVDMFKTLTKSELEGLSDNAQRHYIKKDSVILKQGAGNASMFIIIEGAVSVFSEEDKDNTTTNHFITHLANGDHFGGLSLLTGKPSPVNIHATCNLILIEISKQTMMPILMNRPKLAQNFADFVNARKQYFEFILQQQEQSSSTQDSLMQTIKTFFGLI